MHAAPLDFTLDYAARSMVADAATCEPATSAESEHGAGRGPHVLLATTGQLPSTARMAMELYDAGARVSLIAPSNHPARVLDIFANRSTYSAVSPLRNLQAALRRHQPDMVIPCDERAVRDLHELHRQTQDHDLARLIERSMGPPAMFSVVTSRAALLSLARLSGARVPASMPLPGIEALDDWTAHHPAPIVLKADGSWAGFGVRILPDKGAAKAAFAQMIKPASGFLALREMILEGNPFAIRAWLRRERPVMSVQGHIDGRPANIGVACWQGEVLAASCAESLATASATGASTITRIIYNDEMVDTAKRVVKALRLSGLIGFDFMIEASTGAAYLIEMNPRNTPICAIRLGPGRDLAEALVARLSGRPMRERPPATERDIVVFFPDTWQQDPSNPLLRNGYHDVPWEQPALVRILMRPELRERYWMMRMLRRMWWSLRK